MNELMTADEVAKELRVCRATVIRRIKKKAIKGFRAGKGRNPYLVERKDFEEYKQSLKDATAEESDE